MSDKRQCLVVLKYIKKINYKILMFFVVNYLLKNVLTMELS